MDRITKEKRSWNMSRIRGKDTKPELIVRSQIHAMGYRFRLHVKDLPGKPDILLPKYSTAIFIHGCFWHRHPGCKYAYTPKSRENFWAEKFRKNVERHEKISKELGRLGWRVLIIWECEVSELPALGQKIESFLKKDGG